MNSIDRRRVRKLTAELIELWEDAATESEYWQAIRALDKSKLNWFASFGEDVRHQVMNIAAYRHALKFGFKEISFDEYGWIERYGSYAWSMKERIDFRVNSKHDKQFTGNYIELACGPNGKWTHSVHYELGSGSGGGYAIFPKWHPPVPTRQKALIRALDEIKEHMTEALENYGKAPHNSLSHDPVYMKKVLEKIMGAYPKKEEQMLLQF